jgi:DNA mismatch endonuclease, patch repair protein
LPLAAGRSLVGWGTTLFGTAIVRPDHPSPLPSSTDTSVSHAMKLRDRAVKVRTPSFKELEAASTTTSRWGKVTSRKTGSGCEAVLRQALKNEGVTFSLNDPTVIGTPDIAIPRYRIAIFCDGDFWHGRRLEWRIARLRRGHNKNYWIAKISANVARDRRISRALRKRGWSVLRFWESDILKRPEAIANRVVRKMKNRPRTRSFVGDRRRRPSKQCGS